MRYRLMVLTHGTSTTVQDAMRSFHEHITPPPVDVFVLRDGPGATYVPPPGTFPSVRYVGQLWAERRGFCAATRALWTLAVEAPGNPAEHVFWLEHDFVFERPVDLRHMAEVLDYYSDVAQMSLMRGPESEAEHKAGGVVAELKARGFGFMPQTTEGGHPWLSHQSYLTTNPCLMRRDFMALHRWPDYDERCEGRFSIDLLNVGYAFGIWGEGEAWVRHIGRRDGHGY